MDTTTPADLTVTPAADRIAASLVTYALSNITDLLDQAIGETIADDPDVPEDGTVARDDLWDAVYARLNAAPTEYARRNDVLTAAIAELRSHDGDDWWWDTRDRDAAIGLLAAMTAAVPSAPEA